MTRSRGHSDRDGRPGSGPTTPEGRLACDTSGGSLPAQVAPVGPPRDRSDLFPIRHDAAGLSSLPARETGLRPMSGAILLMSQEQESGTSSRNLTRDIASSMMGRSSARRRHGLARDVLRTMRPSGGQPSQRAGWGATARVGVGLPAAVADPAGPRAGGCHPVGPASFWGCLDIDRSLCDYPR
jgi:hypothetical protein